MVIIKNYLIILKTYSTTATRVNCTIKTYYSKGIYNVYEFDVNFGTYADALYQITIDATDINLGSTQAKSEIFDVKSDQFNTLIIKYKNNDNAFDYNYSTGILNQIRVEAWFWKRKPKIEKTVLRDCDKQKIISASAFRLIALETYLLPAYLQEKLAFIFAHDYVEINGVEFSAGEESYDITYINKYGLQTGMINLEQCNFFDKDNSDDLGINSKDGYIIANNGYLKR